MITPKPNKDMNNSEEINPVTFQFLNSTYLKDLRLTYTNYQNGYG